MKELSKEQLKAVRIEMAVQLCISRPALYRKVTSVCPVWNNKSERLAGRILKGLMCLEPSIGHILKFYYKRERRW